MENLLEVYHQEKVTLAHFGTMIHWNPKIVMAKKGFPSNSIKTLHSWASGIRVMIKHSSLED